MPDLSYNAFQTGSTPPKEGFFSKVGNFLGGVAKDAANTLLVTPAARATEVATRAFAPNSEATKGYQAMSDAGESQNFNSPLGNIEVPAQKAFGQGGAEQIGGNALKSASYLAPAAIAGGLPTLGMAGTGVAKGIVGGAVQGAKLTALGGGLGSTGQSMSQGGSTSDVIGSGLKGATIGAGAGLLLGGATGAVSNVWERAYAPKTSSYDTNLANARANNMQAGAAVTDSIHEASNTLNDMTTGAGNHFAEAPNIISQVDPTARVTYSKDVVADLNALKDTKAWSLPNWMREPGLPSNIENIGSGEITATPQQAQELASSLNDLKFNSKGDVVINQQASNLVSKVKAANQSGLGHVIDTQGNSVWNTAYQDYQVVQDAKDAMSGVLPIKKFQGEILDPTEVNKSSNTMLKMMETPQGMSALIRSNAEIKAATGYDLLNDPMGTISKLAESNENFAKALKGDYMHQFVQGLKNPNMLSRKTMYIGATVISTIIGITAISTAFHKQIGNFIAGQ